MKKWLSTYAIHKRWSIGRLKIKFSMRRSDGFMGRFGGGWNWKVGIQASERTVLLSLLIAELSFYVPKPTAEDEVERARRLV
jgi:hypothetical protein